MFDSVVTPGNRRSFLKKTGGLIALSSLPAYLQALEIAPGGRPQGLIMVNPGMDVSVQAHAYLAATGMMGVALETDIVHQWHYSLQELFNERQLALYGLTSWSDYFVLRGLAAEQRRFPNHEALHRLTPATGEASHIQLKGSLKMPPLTRQNWLQEVSAYMSGLNFNQPQLAFDNAVENMPAGTDTYVSWVIV